MRLINQWCCKEMIIISFSNFFFLSLRCSTFIIQGNDKHGNMINVFHRFDFSYFRKLACDFNCHILFRWQVIHRHLLYITVYPVSVSWIRQMHGSIFNTQTQIKPVCWSGVATFLL